MTAPALPRDADELAEVLADDARVAAMFNPDGTPKPEFGEFVRAYAESRRINDESLGQQVREQVQREIASMIKDNRAEGSIRPDLTPHDKHATYQTANRMALHNPKAPGAILDGEFESSVDFLRTIWHNTDRNDDRVRDRLTKIRAAFSSTDPASGGFLVPEVMRSELLRVSLETSVVRSRARVIPMDSARVPFPAIDSTSNVSSVYGGIVGYWTEEAAALTQSQAAFGRIVLDAKKLTAYTEVPNELVADSAISFQMFIDQMFPEALSFYEDDGFINGNGAGMPLGFQNASAVVTVLKETSPAQAAGTVVWPNLVKMYSRMLPSSLGRAVWVCSPDVFPQLAQMSLTVGTGGAPVWLTDGTANAPMSILGRPLIITEKVPTVGTTGDIMFVDFGYYLIGDRQSMTAASSEHYRFGNDVTAYRFVERVDGRPWLNSAITPRNNSSNTLSPFVRIETR